MRPVVVISLFVWACVLVSASLIHLVLVLGSKLIAVPVGMISESSSADAD